MPLATSNRNYDPNNEKMSSHNPQSTPCRVTTGCWFQGFSDISQGPGSFHLPALFFFVCWLHLKLGSRWLEGFQESQTEQCIWMRVSKMKRGGTCLSHRPSQETPFIFQWPELCSYPFPSQPPEWGWHYCQGIQAPYIPKWGVALASPEPHASWVRRRDLSTSAILLRNN